MSPFAGSKISRHGLGWGNPTPTKIVRPPGLGLLLSSTLSRILRLNSIVDTLRWQNLLSIIERSWKKISRGSQAGAVMLGDLRQKGEASFVRSERAFLG